MTKAPQSLRSSLHSTLSLLVTLLCAIAVHLSVPLVHAEHKLMFSGGHSLEVTAIAVNSSSQLFVTGALDRTAILWQSDTGKQLFQFVGHEDAIRSVAFSRDSRFVVTGSDDSTAMIWSCETGKRIRRLGQHTKKVLSVDFSRSGSQVITGSADSTAIIWNALDGVIQQTLAHGTEVVEAVAFSPNGQQVATATDLGSIAIWNSSTGEKVGSFKIDLTYQDGSSNGKTRLRFSDDGDRLLVFNRFHQLSVLGIANNRRDNTAISSIVDATIVGGQLVACGKVFSEVRNLSTGSQVAAPSWKTSTPGTSCDESPSLPASISNDGDLLLTVKDSNVIVWNVATGKRVRTLSIRKLAQMDTFAFHPETESLFVANSLGTVNVWDTKSGKLHSKFQAAEGPIDRLQFNPNGSLFLVDPRTFTPGGVSVWDARTLQKRYNLDSGKIPGLNVTIGNAEFSADGSHVIGRFVDIGYVFKSETGAKVNEMFPKYSQLVAQSKSGSNVVIANESQLTEMDPRTGQRKVLLGETSNNSSFKQICFSPSSDAVCLVGNKRTFVSSLAKNALEFEIPEIAGEWDEAMFSPDGNRLITSVNAYSYGAKTGHPLCELRDSKTGRSIKKIDYYYPSAFAPNSKTFVLIPAFLDAWNNTAFVADSEKGEFVLALEDIQAEFVTRDIPRMVSRFGPHQKMEQLGFGTHRQAICSCD